MLSFPVGLGLDDDDRSFVDNLLPRARPPQSMLSLQSSFHSSPKYKTSKQDQTLYNSLPSLAGTSTKTM